MYDSSFIKNTSSKSGLRIGATESDPGPSSIAVFDELVFQITGRSSTYYLNFVVRMLGNKLSLSSEPLEIRTAPLLRFG